MEYVPVKLHAGAFDVVTESGTAAGTISKGDLVALIATTDSQTQKVTREFKAATSATLKDVVGIAADAAIKDVPILYYATGEFFESAINLPEGVDIEAAKAQLRSLNIYLVK